VGQAVIGILQQAIPLAKLTKLSTKKAKTVFYILARCFEDLHFLHIWCD
jgi:hypothetical protein